MEQLAVGFVKAINIGKRAVHDILRIKRRSVEIIVFEIPSLCFVPANDFITYHMSAPVFCDYIILS